MYNKILVPVDGSKLAECVFGQLEEMAKGCQVKDIVLATVLIMPNFPFAEYWSQTQINEMIKQQEKDEATAKENAQKYLDGAVEYLKNRGVPCQSVLIKADPMKSTADTLLDYAEKNNFELIIISTHGRSGISRWAFGSVADRIVRSATTPVLTVTPKGCRIMSK